MQTLEQFIAEQQEALEKKKRELAEFEALGPVPGLDPWLIHSKLYGYRSIGFKLVDLGVFLEWAKAHCLPVKAIEGRYKTFRPEIPQTRDYEDSKVVAEGDLCVTYSTIMHRFKIEVYVPGFEVQFEIPGHMRDLMPRPVFREYHREFTGNRNIESWQKSGYGVRQYLRVSVDKQSADLETLLTWEQFEECFVAKKEAA